MNGKSNQLISQQPTAEVTEDEFQRVFDVNVKGIFLAVQAFMPKMIAQGQGGSMINISSTGAARPRPGLVWYNASKGAVSNVRPFNLYISHATNTHPRRQQKA